MSKKFWICVSILLTVLCLIFGVCSHRLGQENATLHIQSTMLLNNMAVVNNNMNGLTQTVIKHKIEVALWQQKYKILEEKYDTAMQAMRLHGQDYD